MLPAFASSAELAARIPGGIENGEMERALAALDDASSLIRDEAGKTWVDDEGELALPTGTDAWRADTLVRVCCSAARRSLENPDGVSQESLGGYAVSTANASSDVYLTSGERRAVRRAAGKATIGAIPVTRGPIETRTCTDTQYLPVTPEGQAIPFAGPEGY